MSFTLHQITKSSMPMASRLKSMISVWLPVVVWLAVIFVESTDLMSSTNTGHILYSFLTRLFGPIDPAHFAVFHAIVRKVGHFTGYGILGLLFFRAIRRTVLELKPAATLTRETTRQRLFRWACEAVFCTFVVAALDEWHQTFLPSRTGAFHDVVLDTLGAVVLVLFVAFRYSRAVRASEAE